MSPSLGVVGRVETSASETDETGVLDIAANKCTYALDQCRCRDNKIEGSWANDCSDDVDDTPDLDDATRAFLMR